MNTVERDIDQLNSFLRGELAAVETYTQAMEKLSSPRMATEFAELQHSHRRRAQKLSERIRAMGGNPAEGSGMWGSFAKLVEGGAKVFGESAAIAALEEGEDHGRDDYRSDIDELTPATRAFVTKEIIPEQELTHQILSGLKRAAS